MSTGCWRVKPSEIQRTLESIKKAGLRVRAVEVTAHGAIKVSASETNSADGQSQDRQA